MGSPERGIAVFGGVEAEPGDAAYELARRVGCLVAERGLPVVTGGYGGVMEAASRGAREAGGEAVGVTCAAFRGRTPNPYLTLEIEEPTLSARTERLVALSRGFVVLAGRAGTLAELAYLWAALRAGVIAAPVAILDDAWSALYRELVRSGRLDERPRRATRVARDADEAVAIASGGGSG
ncbi:MAG: DNA-binding protein [Acidobacteria bacterium]|nr:MAG: DNA-binding protein [Acidobacteriota bacterium]